MEYNRRKTDRKEKRKPPWLLGGFVLLLLSFLILLQSSNLWKTLTVDSASDTLLLYALSSLNFIAFVIFAFIFVRSLLKLWQERRALQIGSKIKTRLLIYFFAVSLLPLIAMAVFSYLFMNRALERWFTQIPESVVRQAGINQTATMLAKTLDSNDIENGDLKKVIDAGSFARVEVVSPEFKPLAFEENNLTEEQRVDIEKVLQFVRRGELNEPALSDGKSFDIALAEMADGNWFVAIADMSSTETLSPVAQSSLREFDRLKSQQIFVRQIGLSTLGLLTFLLIFASSWTAFYVAKGLTRPIRALAEGADQISRGKLGFQVDIIAEDELETLVKAFNAMSGKLSENATELRERRRYIETVLQSLSTGVISFDDQNNITTINHAANRMFGLEDADISDLELKQLVSGENFAILERLISRAKRIGQAAEQTTLVREHTDESLDKGEDLPVALTATALPHENGAVLVIEDLTELIAAQRASAWREVARRMAHEIKNPLTPIQLSAERIAKRFASQNGDSEDQIESPRDLKFPDPENAQQNLIKEGTDTILREVSSLKSMVNEFSRFARLPNVKLENGDLNDLISKAALLYKDRISGIQISTDLGSDMPTAMIDQEQLKRVFVNLIDNAIEAFDDSQTDRLISVSTSYDKSRDHLIAQVTDNGNGIPGGDYRRIFQPYFSTKGRGTGLGLAIVQRIVSEHGGQIRAGSNTTGGTQFTIELPASN